MQVQLDREMIRNIISIVRDPNIVHFIFETITNKYSINERVRAGFRVVTCVRILIIEASTDMKWREESVLGHEFLNELREAVRYVFNVAVEVG